MPKLVLDVDTGIDDALAILLALGSPHTEVLGITTVAGNVGLERVVPNTLLVLEAAGRDVPVYPGAERPLLAAPVSASHVHGEDGLAGLAARRPRRAPRPERAADFLVAAARAHPGEITLVATAPLTNLAVALQADPDLPRLLAGLVIMGGAYRVPGNVTPLAEFNFYADPAAARIVLQHASPLLVGLDVTETVALTAAMLAEVAPGAGPAARLVRGIAHFWQERFGETGMPLHDPTAVAVALDPSLAAIEAAGVTIVTSPGPARGQSLVDEAGPGTPPAPARICRRVDAEGVRQRLGRAVAALDRASGAHAF